ncbi:MAG: thioredoxin family protein [Trueperaceae bacterium]
MERFLDETLTAQLAEAFAPLDRDVEMVVHVASRLVVPGQEDAGEEAATLQLVREVAETSERLTVVETTLDGDARARGIVRTPTIVFRAAGSDADNVRFVGLPSGYEFQTLVEVVRMVGTGDSGLGPASSERLADLEAPVRLQAFVTPTCPYCPRAVLAAYRMALANPNVIAEGVEASEFPELAQRYRISGVPDTVIDGPSGQERVLGGQPDKVFLDAVLKVAGTAASNAAPSATTA